MKTILALIFYIVALTSSSPWRQSFDDLEEMVRDVRQSVLKTQSDVDLIINMEIETMEHLKDLEEDLEHEIESNNQKKYPQYIEDDGPIGDFIY